MARPAELAHDNIRAIINEFASWRFDAGSVVSALQRLMAARMARPGRYALVGQRRHATEVGVAIDGAIEMGDAGILAMVRLGRLATYVHPTWTDVSVTIDDGLRVDQFGLYGQANGVREQRAGHLVYLLGYHSVHEKLEKGRLINPIYDYPGPSMTGEERSSLLLRAARVLGTGAVNAEVTQAYLKPENIRSHPHLMTPIDYNPQY